MSFITRIKLRLNWVVIRNDMGRAGSKPRDLGSDRGYRVVIRFCQGGKACASDIAERFLSACSARNDRLVSLIMV